MPFIYKSHGVIDATEVLQAKGKRVCLHGLCNVSLNGFIGTVLPRRRCKPGRTAVILDRKPKPICIKDENIEKLGPPYLPVATSSTDYRLHQLIKDPTRDSLSTSGRCFIEVSAACDLLQKPAEWNINYGTMKMEVRTRAFMGYDATYDLVPGHLPCAPLLELRKSLKGSLKGSKSSRVARCHVLTSKFILRL